ncbi:hypothetical protein AA313_de0206115 [Arthrobotrys entomopaga]|nr:hypothetical protein AA313_de0206115 [Arthrobotrys entomopaga]
MSFRKSYSYKHYTVAVVTTLELEMTAIRYMLDDEHERLPLQPGDSNLYTLGKLNRHNVVLVCLPGTQGNNESSSTVTDMRRTFPSIEWLFVIGIGGGVPSDKHDIRLGDVVIGMPVDGYTGITQYDSGRATQSGYQLKGFTNPAPAILRNIALAMKSDRVDMRLNRIVSEMAEKEEWLAEYNRPSDKSDDLFAEDYLHIPGKSTCSDCDPTKIQARNPRRYSNPVIHHGLIGSGNTVMKDVELRNSIIGNVGDIICFAMEDAGVAARTPCIAIRGIADYADSHKNDDWQYYAAATAAATTKVMISYLNFASNSADVASSSKSRSRRRALRSRSYSQEMGIQNFGSGLVTIGRDLNMGKR